MKTEYLEPLETKLLAWADELAEKFRLEPTFAERIDIEVFMNPKYLNPDGELTDEATIGLELQAGKLKVQQERAKEAAEQLAIKQQEKQEGVPIKRETVARQRPDLPIGEDGKIACQVYAVFIVRARPSTTARTIEDAVRNRLENAGFSKIQQVTSQDPSTL